MQAFDWIARYEFAQHALIAGLAVATVCSLLSVIVVLKRMAFVGEGISHSGFGGMGIAVFLGYIGWSMDILVFAFCLIIALLIGVLSRKRHVEADSAIGILLVAAMSLGVLMTDLRKLLISQQSPWYLQLLGPSPQSPPNVESLMFGSILNVSSREAWLSVIIACFILVTLAAFGKEIMFYVFDEASAVVFGIRTRFIHFLLLFLLCISIVMTVRLMGIVLVSALLVIPGATALMVSRQLYRVLGLAWLIGTGGMITGLLISFELGHLSTGPCIVAVMCLLFALVWLIHPLGRQTALTR